MTDKFERTSTCVNASGKEFSSLLLYGTITVTIHTVNVK